MLDSEHASIKEDSPIPSETAKELGGPALFLTLPDPDEEFNDSGIVLPDPDEFLEDTDNHSSIRTVTTPVSSYEEKEHDAHFDATLFTQFAVRGLTADNLNDDPDTAVSYAKWLANLTSEDRVAIAQEKYRNDTYDIVAQNLMAQIPEYFVGKIPDYQARLFPDKNFILGVNQSGTDDVTSAIDYVVSIGGIDMRNSPLGQRFRIIDRESAIENPDLTENILVAGYYGTPGTGKFVIAIPYEGSVNNFDETTSLTSMPDLTGVNHLNEEDFTISPKYISGFIDEHGNFYPNKNFGLSTDFELVSSENENSSLSSSKSEVI